MESALPLPICTEYRAAENIRKQKTVSFFLPGLSQPSHTFTLLSIEAPVRVCLWIIITKPCSHLHVKFITMAMDRMTSTGVSLKSKQCSIKKNRFDGCSGIGYTTG